MAKKINKDGLDNLGGFIRVGAHAESKFKVPTGYFNLDFAINFGTLPSDMVELGSSHKVYDPSKPLGIPSGRLVEVFGPEGGGKSYLCYRIVACAQKMGLTAAWIDTEQSFSEDLAIINGVDLDKLVFSDVCNTENPDEIFCAEDVMDGIVEIIKRDIAQVVILDSVANLIPKTVMENSAEKQTMAELARLMGRTIGKVTQYAGAKDALVVFVNQIREKPGIMFGNPETTPGGRTLKHAASLRIKITRRFGKDACIFIPDPDNPSEQRLIGRNSYIQLEKNRFAKPLLDSKGGGISIDVPIYYEPYFPDIEEIIFDAARQHQIIKVYKGEFRWNQNDEIKHAVAGRKQFIEYLKNNDLVKDLVAEIKKVSEDSGVPLPPEMIKDTEENLKTTKKMTKQQVIEIAGEIREDVAEKKKRGRPSKKEIDVKDSDVEPNEVEYNGIDDFDDVNVDDIELKGEDAEQIDGNREGEDS